jgi:hypothetical protein
MMKLPLTMALCGASILLMGAAPQFDSKPWLEDLDQSRAAFTDKYANFDWAVFEREVDLPRLFDETKDRLAAARNEGEAKATFDRLARQLGDGHVEFQWPSVPTVGGRDSASFNPCADLGYDARKVGRPLASHMQGYKPIPGASQEFSAGLITIGHTKIGVIKIGLFSPEGSLFLCDGAAQALKISPTESCDDACSNKVEDWASGKMTKDFEATLLKLHAAGATTLLIDITQNGGGSEWTEAAARMVTSLPLTSERLGFVRGAHWVKKWSDLTAELTQAAPAAPDVDRVQIMELAREAEAKARIADTRCSSEPFWKKEQPACQWLGDGAYATGLIGSAKADGIERKPWTSLVFSPAKYPYKDGVWRGPLIVVVDSDTWSAAEEFAAVLQDNHAAIIIGAPTGGAGCGHTDGGTPTTLVHSRGVLKLPDCARLRANGDNEVAGIQPDVLIGFRRYDGVDRQAKFLKDKLPEAVRLAAALKQ